MPVLLVRHNEEIKRFEYERGRDIFIGRGDDNDISFPHDLKLSKKHCKIFFYAEKDCYAISDLNSTNGTTLNQNRIATDIILSDNDKIQVGDIRILFKYDSFDSPTKTKKILKLVKKPKTGIFEQTDTLKLPNASELQKFKSPTAGTVSSFQIGEQIKDYQVDSIMFQTKHGTLYKVIGLADSKPYVLKKYSLNFAEEHPAIEDFNNVFAILNKIDNPYFNEVVDYGFYKNSCFQISNFLSTDNLTTEILQNAPYPEYDAICIAYTIGAALENAYSNYNIIHGMLTPDNIFIDENNSLFISELGLSHWLKKYYTSSKTLVHAEYATPEEIQGAELDWKIDLYSLGIIFYQLLTGFFPFQGNTIEETYQLHVNAELPHPQSLNPNIWISDLTLQILAKMLAKDYTNRFENWQQFLDDISRSYEQFDLQ